MGHTKSTISIGRRAPFASFGVDDFATCMDKPKCLDPCYYGYNKESRHYLH